MAENNERSHSDELFELLNEFNGDKPASKPDENITANEVSDHVDELLEILSKSSGEDAEQVEQTEDTEESTLEPEIPSSLFHHLSNEGDSIDGDNGAKGIHVTSAGSHFTDETEPAPPLPEGEEEIAEEEPEEEEKISVMRRIGRILGGSSFIPKAVVYVVIVCLVSVYTAWSIISIGNDIFSLVTDSHQVTIYIPEGADDKTVADILVENGVIDYGWAYELYMQYRGDSDEKAEYLPGEHTISTDMNYSQLIYQLTHGSTTREIKRVTIPEGYTVDQIIELLIENGIGQRADYIEAINNYPYKWEFVEQLEELTYSDQRVYRLEGYLYPDTYDFYTDEDEVYVINKMLSAFYSKFWKDFVEVDEEGNSYQSKMLADYGLTFDDVVTFASMLQSEGGTASDFYYISYVFHNRMKNSSTFPKFESDATIQYVLAERVPSSELDTTYETPYNTYLYEGLPPGAISNPGLEALSAALFPEKPEDPDSDPDDPEYIDAFYFVSNDKGKTYYAHSERGHENNKEQVKKDNEAIKAGTYEG